MQSLPFVARRFTSAIPRMTLCSLPLQWYPTSSFFGDQRLSRIVSSTMRHDSVSETCGSIVFQRSDGSNVCSMSQREIESCAGGLLTSRRAFAASTPEYRLPFAVRNVVYVSRLNSYFMVCPC